MTDTQNTEVVETPKVSPFELVANMNIAFENPRGDIADINFVKLKSQCANIPDERNEFLSALNENSMDDARDALCDIAVFVHGAQHIAGIHADVSWEFFLSEAKNIPVGDSTALNTNTDLFVAADRIKMHYGLLQVALEKRIINDVFQELSLIMQIVVNTYAILGYDYVRDMTSVVEGVMTRFIKDPADEEATIAMHAAKGITQYSITGEYPTKIMKSTAVQPDAPIGKFLKSASYKAPVFYQL